MNDLKSRLMIGEGDSWKTKRVAHSRLITSRCSKNADHLTA